MASAVLTLVIGPRYLDPLPVWSKAVIALVGCAIIAAVAVYGRRRARRI